MQDGLGLGPAFFGELPPGHFLVRDQDARRPAAEQAGHATDKPAPPARGMTRVYQLDRLAPPGQHIADAGREMAAPSAPLAPGLVADTKIKNPWRP